LRLFQFSSLRSCYLYQRPDDVTANRKPPLDVDQVREGVARWVNGRLGQKGLASTPLDVRPNRDVARQLVGRGWWRLLDEAFNGAEAAGATVMQIKEKFGGLRVYFEDKDGHPALIELERCLEDHAFTVCEACGAPGRPRDDFVWCKTLCDGCCALRAGGRTWEDIFGFQPYTTPSN
jgi:hypothetical protein